MGPDGSGAGVEGHSSKSVGETVGEVSQVWVGDESQCIGLVLDGGAYPAFGLMIAVTEGEGLGLPADTTLLDTAL
jgi:hypothetical protein